MGTVLGATVGIVVAGFGPNLVVFGTGVLILGLLSAALHSDRNAYRFAGVTLAIVLLVPGTNSAWRFALHRFAEVCIGIGVALVLTLFWPEGKNHA